MVTLMKATYLKRFKHLLQLQNAYLKERRVEKIRQSARLIENTLHGR